MQKGEEVSASQMDIISLIWEERKARQLMILKSLSLYGLIFLTKREISSSLLEDLHFLVFLEEVFIFKKHSVNISVKNQFLSQTYYIYGDADDDNF